MLKRILAVAAVASFVMASVAFAATQFSDVPADHWAADAVSWVNDTGIMTGPGDAPGTFDPAGAVNRAQLATVSQRLYGVVQDDLDLMEADMDAMQAEIDALSAQVAELQVLLGIEGSEEEEEMEVSVSFTANLSGDSEVPAVATAGSGEATLKLDIIDGKLVLEYSVVVENLSGPVTAAHFHEGLAGTTGPAVHDITFSDERASGTWDLTEEEAIKLKNGEYYINVHTDENPDGEVRGQVLMDS